VQDIILEDIERIEVIRGPGAALWGANAVNGVINIITKKTEKTQGTYVSQLIGTQDRSISEARYGGAVGDDLFYRAYAKYANRMSSETLTGDNGGNHWNSGKTGFRTDYDVSPTRKITVQGDAYQERIGLDIFLPSQVTPPASYLRDTFDSRGLNILGRWTEKHGDGMESTFQAYYDYQSPSYSLLKQDINTFDFDYQTAWTYNDSHQFVWGAGYRLVSDKFRGSPALSLTPNNRDISLYSAFLQDTVTLIPKTLDLTLGSKIEHNDYTGVEAQPSAKLAWYPTTNQTVWASVSRAVRTPSRIENNGKIDVQYVPNIGIIAQQQGNPNFKSEELASYELGYRIRPTNDVLFDISTFINDYDKLRTFEFGAPQITAAGAFLPLVAQNLGEGQTYGFELASTWDVTPTWSLKGAYTYTYLDLRNKSGSTDITLAQEKDKVPENKFNIRSDVKITDSIELVNTVYYVDKLPLYNIDNYLRFDTGINWAVDTGIDVSFVGQNLLDNAHQEFGASVQSVPNQVERNVYAKVTFRY
jgi:iron complex outermembrane receptor protein